MAVRTSMRVDPAAYERAAAGLREAAAALEESLARLGALPAPATGHEAIDAACLRLVEAWRPRLAGALGAVRDAADRLTAGHAAHEDADVAAAAAIAAAGCAGRA